MTDTANAASRHPAEHDNRWKLVLGSIGIVYGDIGTSPIYAFREGLRATRSGGAMAEDVIGIVSLLLWTLIVIVTVKYVILILRADNRGEGGTLSLLALAEQAIGRRTTPLLILAIVGTSLFFGDALITPAISVLSAVEGLKLVTPALDDYVLPITICILVVLFWVQSYGTERVSSLFGPITLVWFLVIGGLGALHIGDNPAILYALDPLHGAGYILSHGVGALPIIAAVFLAVTGAEALYADMGHFGRGPIRIAWSSLVLPMLALSYVGQGALVLDNPAMAANPFFLMAPSWGLLPLVLLATIATVIASQAVISGAFSVAQQAVLLGLLPRLQVIHTSDTRIGQIYVPRVNWFMLVGVLLLVLVFKESEALASAYGIAVTGDMLITSLLVILVFRLRWNWPILGLVAVFVPILAIEFVFLGANLTKVADGGYVTITIAALLAIGMWTWVRGRAVVEAKVREESVEIETTVRSLESSKRIARVPGTAIYLSPEANVLPSALMHNVKHNQVLHERNYIVHVNILRQPVVADDARLEITPISDSFAMIEMDFGYTEPANVPKALAQIRKEGLKFDIMSTSFFLHRRAFKSSPRSPLPAWQSKIFVAMARSASDTSSFYHLPSNRVIELGQQMNV